MVPFDSFYAFIENNITGDSLTAEKCRKHF